MPQNPTNKTNVAGDLDSRVLDSLIAPVAVLDQGGTIRATNAAWRRFAIAGGASPNTTGVGANYFEVCERVSGEDALLAEQACDGIRDVLSGRREVFKLEYPCHSPTERRWFLLHVSPLIDGADHVVTTHLPITERKLLEQQLVATERLAAIGQAMQGLSNEGRNSLQRAQGCIDLLRCKVENDAEATKLLNRIERSQRRLIGLYEEVRAYAAPVRLQRGTCALDALVEEVWSTVAPANRRVTLQHLPAPVNVACDIDADAMRQVFTSLLVNALSAESETAKIEIKYEGGQLDRRPAISVLINDDGVGIPDHDRERVFEPFFTTKTRGTGLGLASCRRIVEAHRGQIEIVDPVLGGTSIRMTLPASE